MITFTTYQVTDGVTEVNGVLELDAFGYTYTAVDLSRFGHQIQLVPFAGWGVALGASLTGQASASGTCVLSNASFPSQPASPFGTSRGGEAFYDTTAVAEGAFGDCSTTWKVIFTIPDYSPGSITTSMNDVRCDNALGANLNRPWLRGGRAAVVDQ